MQAANEVVPKPELVAPSVNPMLSNAERQQLSDSDAQRGWRDMGHSAIERGHSASTWGQAARERESNLERKGLVGRIGRANKTAKRRLFFLLEFGKAHSFYERACRFFLISLTTASVLLTMVGTVGFDTCAFPAWRECQSQEKQWICPKERPVGSNGAAAAAPWKPQQAKPRRCQWKGDPDQVYNQPMLTAIADLHAVVECVAILVFTAEFLLRIWTCTVNKHARWTLTDPSQRWHWPVHHTERARASVRQGQRRASMQRARNARNFGRARGTEGASGAGGVAGGATSFQLIHLPWSNGERDKFRVASWAARLRFLATPSMLLDAAVLVPPFLHAGVGRSSKLSIGFNDGTLGGAGGAGGAFDDADGKHDFLTLTMLVLRIFRVFKFYRYTSAMRVIFAAVKECREFLVQALVLDFILIISFAAAIFVVENYANTPGFQDLGLTFYWSAITLSTIGYGDIYPMTPLGRLLTMAIAPIGIGLFTMPATALAKSFERMKAERRTNKHEALSKVFRMLSRKVHTDFNRLREPKQRSVWLGEWDGEAHGFEHRIHREASLQVAREMAQQAGLKVQAVRHQGRGAGGGGAHSPQPSGARNAAGGAGSPGAVHDRATAETAAMLRRLCQQMDRQEREITLLRQQVDRGVASSMQQLAQQPHGGQTSV
jgi:hypothetical protein